jgi:hypothetical protein
MVFSLHILLIIGIRPGTLRAFSGRFLLYETDNYKSSHSKPGLFTGGLRIL